MEESQYIKIENVKNIEPEEIKYPIDEKIYNKTKEFTKHIEGRIWETPLNNQKPPYLPVYFAKWRKEALFELNKFIKTESFEIKQQYLQAFEEQVDGNYLDDFLLKLKAPYFDAIYFDNYGVPQDIDLHKIKKDKTTQAQGIQDLAYQITQWCLQIEISSDIVERSEDLQLYTCGKSEAEVYRDLKKQLAGERHQSYFDKSKEMVRKGFSTGMKKLSSFAWNTGVSSAQGNMTYATIFLLFYNLLGTGSIPLSFVFPQSKLVFFAGGLIGSSFALNSAADMMEQNEVQLELQDLIDAFKNITLNLKQFNKECSQCIIQCLAAKDDKLKAEMQLELKLKFRELLDQTDKFKEQRDQVMQIRKLVEIDLEDDWTMLSLKEDVKPKEDIEMEEKQEMQEEEKNDDQQ